MGATPAYCAFRRLQFAVLLILGAVVVYSTLIEPNQMRVTRHDVPISGLPKSCDGLTIAQISDIHAGPYIRPGRIAKIVEQVNALHPDIVVLTGDYISKYGSGAASTGNALAGLRAKYGVYAVLGNHDYWVNPTGMSGALRDAHIRVLFNESREVRIGADSIRILGFDDLWEGDHHLSRAFTGVPPGQICIGLAHNPDTALRLVGRPISLLVTGHTHGGMINLPRIGPIFCVTSLGTKYSSGMFTIKGIRTYIDRGVGSSWPVRFRCPPEIPVFTLRQAN